jgi:excisionase family DNA binding protein
MATPAKTRLTLTVPEAAEKLGIGRNQGYQAAQSGQIPTIRIGKRVLVPIAALEARLASASVPQGKAKKTAAAR